MHLPTNQSGAAEAWWAHNPQVPGSKPGSDISREKASQPLFFSISKLRKIKSKSKSEIDSKLKPAIKRWIKAI